jgi:hypothetical protein
VAQYPTSSDKKVFYCQTLNNVPDVYDWGIIDQFKYGETPANSSDIDAAKTMFFKFVTEVKENSFNGQFAELWEVIEQLRTEIEELKNS